MIPKWDRGLCSSAFNVIDFRLALFEVLLLNHVRSTKTNLYGHFFRIRPIIITFEGFFGGLKTAKSSIIIY